MIWKKQKDESPAMMTPAPAASDVAESGPGSPLPAAPLPAPRAGRPEAVIGKSVFIKGQVLSEEDVLLEGQVEGSIDLPANKLIVGRSGKVQAHIKAREVDVQGTVHGNITAGEKIVIRGAANLAGDLRSATISIEDGAYFKGSIDIVRTPSRPAPETPPAPSQRLPAAAPSTPETRSIPPEKPRS
jgi:cytoskeletal protein CcmA (bactofilin family)